MSTEIHEASHAACAILLGRRVEHVERDPGLVLVGEELGYCLAPIDGKTLELDEKRSRPIRVMRFPVQ